MDERPHRNDIDWERLERFVTRQGTPAELEALEHWVNADPELVRIVETMRTIGMPRGATSSEKSGRTSRGWDERSAWSRLREQMHRTPVRPMRVHRATPPQLQRIRAPHSRWLGVAAAAVLIVAVSVGTFLERSKRRGSEVVTKVAPSREIATRRGERATIDLADGTHVVLAPGSRLVIPGDFNSDRSRSRELALDGEAHFTVQHDSTRPFRVVTSHAVAQDIGTAFVVSSYPETNGTRVVVTEGLVALRRPAASQAVMVLARGELGRVDSAGTATRESNVDIARYLAWTRDTLVFDGARLSAAIPQLERWFDIDISLAGAELAQRRLTGSFAHGSPERLLEALSIALDVNVTRTGGSVVLSGRRSGDRQ